MVVESYGTIAGSGMALTGDNYGNLHLFYPNVAEEGLVPSIDYTIWNGSEWSQPNDIIVGTMVAFPMVALDAAGLAHLIWLDGGARLQYSSAPIAEARSAQAWKQPKTFGYAMGAAGIAINEEGEIYVAYADFETQRAILLTKSADGGTNWSDPILIAEVSRANVAPNGVQIAIDGSGRLHVVWTEWILPSGAKSVGTFYARLT